MLSGQMDTDGLPIVVQTASLSRRFGAYFFDSLLITLAVAVVFYTLLGFDDTLYTHQINYGDLLYELNEVEKAIGFWERALYLGILPELAKRRLQYCRILTPSVY